MPPLAYYRHPGWRYPNLVFMTAWRLLPSGSLQAGVVHIAHLPQGDPTRPSAEDSVKPLASWVPNEYMETIPGQDYTGLPTFVLEEPDTDDT